jgi:hypothetical protein
MGHYRELLEKQQLQGTDHAISLNATSFQLLSGMLPHWWKECGDDLIRGELQHPWLLFEDSYETTISR